MNASVLVPVMISAEAAALIDELGLRRPVEEMIEHTRQVITGVQSIEIEGWYEHDTEDRPPLPHITLIGWRNGHRTPADGIAEREWFKWSIRTYPSEVKEHISFVVQNGARIP